MADISENDDDEVPSQKKQKIVYPQKTRDLVDKKAAKAEQEQDSDGELEEIYDQDGTLHYKKRRAEPEEDDFERQLRLEREEAERKAAAAKKTKTDADGTEYEWDETVKGWFPKVINQNLEALIVRSDSSFLSRQSSYQIKSSSSTSKSTPLPQQTPIQIRQSRCSMPSHCRTRSTCSMAPSTNGTLRWTLGQAPKPASTPILTT